MSKKRVHFTSAEKLAILRKYLLEQVPISQLCDENKIKVSRFYDWQKAFFDNGVAAFEVAKKPKKDIRDKKIKDLEAKIADRDEGIAELMMEHVKIKNLDASIRGISPASLKSQTLIAHHILFYILPGLQYNAV